MAAAVSKQGQAGRSEALRARGIDHLALNTADMAATVAFYGGVLGMRLIHAMRTPPVDAALRIPCVAARLRGGDGAA
jgi:catechol 2,3-dioxygenase-like lactoylglutathione lyase family enzyme